MPKKRWDGEQPFGKKELLTQIFAKPVMETRSLDLTFPWIDEEELYEVQPGSSTKFTFLKLLLTKYGLQDDTGAIS